MANWSPKSSSLSHDCSEERLSKRLRSTRRATFPQAAVTILSACKALPFRGEPRVVTSNLPVKRMVFWRCNVRRIPYVRRNQLSRIS